MAATSTSSNRLRSAALSAPAHGLSTLRQRRVSPQAGHALEILGHAIEYLADEYNNPANLLARNESNLEAIQILMEHNREIYAECPEIPTVEERIARIFKGK